jgi:hypothetical protein
MNTDSNTFFRREVNVCIHTCIVQSVYIEVTILYMVTSKAKAEDRSLTSFILA